MKIAYVVVVFNRQNTDIPDVNVYSNRKDADEFVAIVKSVSGVVSSVQQICNADNSEPGTVYEVFDAVNNHTTGILIREVEVQDYQNDEDV